MFRDFVRGYRANFRQALAVWLPYVAVLAGVTAMLLLSRFTFRTPDLYRLSLYCLGAQKRVSLGKAGILFITAFLLTATTAGLLMAVVDLFA